MKHLIAILLLYILIPAITFMVSLWVLWLMFGTVTFYEFRVHQGSTITCGVIWAIWIIILIIDLMEDGDFIYDAFAEEVEKFFKL